MLRKKILYENYSKITAFFARKKKKKILYKGKERLLYPQDIILDKTLLPLIPVFITPTYITVIRILLTPLIAFFILRIENLFLVLLTYVLVSFTDMIDGALARTRDQISTLGKALDPVADKILFLSCAVILLPKYGATNILVILIFLEIITMITSGLFIGKKRDISANIYGKIKLNLQVLGILIFILIDHNQKIGLAIYGKVALYLSIILGFISYFFYFKNKS